MSRIAIVQARMGASRFPGKVLAPLRGRPILECVIRRLSAANLIDDILVATSRGATDDVIELWSRGMGVRCFRGDEQDVLGRFHAAACDSDASWIIRVNADNPFVDPGFVDALLAAAPGYDYAGYQTSSSKHTMLTGIGLFTEVLSSDCLQRAAATIHDPWLREHVTLGIYTNPSRYNVTMLTVPEWCDFPWLRLTLDTPEDHKIFDAITARFGNDPLRWSARDIVEAVSANPDWRQKMVLNAETNPKTVRSARQ